MKITNIRLERERPGRIDGGEYHKPVWVLRYDYKGIPRRRPVKCGGESKPLGQDVINACRGLVLTEAECLDIPVRE